MAIKDATCPACCKPIKLNDEKPFGFCSFCGHKINTAEYFASKASAVQAETDKPAPAAAPISASTPTPAAAPSIKITQDAQSNQPDRSDVYALLDRTGIYGPASART